MGRIPPGRPDEGPATESGPDRRPENSSPTGNEPVNEQVLILFHDTMYGQPLELDRFRVPGVRFSDNKELLPDADAVVFHVPDHFHSRHLPVVKPPGQLWVCWSLESVVNYPMINDPMFDLKMTYQRDADVWLPYFKYCGPTFLDDLSKPDRTKRASFLLSSFISSPVNRNNRLEYLKELDKHLEIHHYGEFLRNRWIDCDRGSPTKRAILEDYKFTIAFEGSSTLDYVTEKYFDPLLSGTIPVYMGAPNIDDYAPGRCCHINVADYESPSDLAGYLKTLDKDEALLRKHLAWRQVSLRQGFVDMVSRERERPHPFVRLAKLVLKRDRAFGKSVPVKTRGWRLAKRGNRISLTERKSGAELIINASASLTWSLIDGCSTVSDICAELRARYASDTNAINKDVKQILRIFHRHGAVNFGAPS